ncbi:MAG: reverse gyrase [Thermofilaceae archaeon]
MSSAHSSLMARMLIREQCPNCGGAISDERLAAGLPCEVCLPEPPLSLAGTDKPSKLVLLKTTCDALSLLGKCKGFKSILEEEAEIHDFELFFENAVGSRPWSAQRMWARRVLRGLSFVILAPTGVGKSVFGIVMSLYLALRGKRCYLILPTSVLVKQTFDRLQGYASKLGLNVKVLAYTSRSGKARNDTLKKIEQSDYDILITTSQFLSKNFELIKNSTFDFIFVDDVDAIIKSSKNVEKVLALLGLGGQVINEALKIAKMAAARRSEGDANELEKARARLREMLAQTKHGILVVSTATGRPRGLRVKLFRELLNFEIGSGAELLRNVVDSYSFVSDGKTLSARVAEIAGILGKGGLIYVQPGTPEEQVNELIELLESKGLRAKALTSRSKRELEDFERGEIDILIGFATYYGVLVRGIDLPHVIRYAIFVDVPHFRFAAGVDEASPLRLLQLAQVLRSVLRGSEANTLDKLTSVIRRYTSSLDQASYRLLTESLATTRKPEGFLGFLYERLLELRSLLRELLSREELLKELQASSLASIKMVNGKPYIILPDAPTYLQASGRTSRMYAGGISKGLSVIVTRDESLLKVLMRQVSWYVDDAKWVRFEDLDLVSILKEIDRDREMIQRLKEGRVEGGIAELVKTALVVVESPTKARTIASFFGRPSSRRIGSIVVHEVSAGNLQLLVAASKGHVLDLVTDDGFYGVRVNGAFVPVYTTVKRCLSCGTQFTDSKDGVCPRCGKTVVADQAEVVKALQRVAGEVDTVLLATDPDTEGEKIAWDLYILLAPYTRSLKRIEFHEITRRAFEEALKNPRSVDMRRVEAQLIRRIEDRWLGFTLSRKLWDRFGMHWLSAGRVQTPVLGWVVERYQKARESVMTVFRVKLDNGLTLVFESNVSGNETRKLARELKEGTVAIERLSVESSKLHPPPPFSTDAMLKEAVEVLNLSTEEVMRLAQDLFEMGLITYHRTDSTHVSALGIGIAKSYIVERFGEAMFTARAWGSPGAHECIRPTRPLDAETLKALVSQGILQLARPLTQRHYRLYDLIFRRFIASQMPECTVKIERLKVTLGPLTKEMTTYVEVVDPGFTHVYQRFKLARLEPGTYKVVDLKHRRIPTLRLYSQADLVARMKEEGIGRPSTYAKIIATLIDRRYVIETKRHKLVPTDLGLKVYSYLSENYRDLISVERTRIVEELMDKVERGEANYMMVLRDLYEEVVKIG